MESVGLKEWALVCEALGRGEQKVILRKGGLAEGRGGFSFRHDAFFLVPTYFHEQLEKTRLRDVELPPYRPGEIEIRYHARVERAEFITTWSEVEALEPLHVLTSDVVRDRFGCGKAAGLHVAWVRVSRLEQPWILAELASYRGCKSWID